MSAAGGDGAGRERLEARTLDWGQHPVSVPAGATEILLVRHGATIAWREDRPFELTDGHGDPPLGPAGLEQAQRLADRLGDERVDRIYVTPLRRTRETAEPLATRLGVPLVVVPELIEVHLGDWERGDYRMRMTTGDPAALRAFAAESWELIPNAEKDAGFRARVRAGVDRIVEASGPGRVIAVAHAAVIAEVLRDATGSRPFAFLLVDNASISRLVVLADGRRQIHGFNDTGHL